MPNDPVYKNSGFYRGSAPVALLCEGDVIGYESQFLSRWFRSPNAGSLKIDVWACGTGHGLRAIADSYGREVKIVGIEDRDFRSDEQASADCQNRLQDLEGRGVAVRGWFAWGRNEIENYFLDDKILNPVMVNWFGCKDDDVNKALDTAVQSLKVFQAVQASVYGIRRWWEHTDPAVSFRGSECLYVGGRPNWTENGLASPDKEQIKEKLLVALNRWRERFAGDKTKTPLPEKADMEKVFDEYTQVHPVQNVEADVWRTDWAGKEILKLVRQQLAHSFGRDYGGRLRDILKQQGIELGDTIPWHRWNRQTRDSIDRELEHEIQSRLVKQLFEDAANNPTSEIRTNLNRIWTALTA